MSIQFTKMHGLGNDFAVIETVHQSLVLTKQLVQQMADRHFGIGFDQLLVIAPPTRPEVDFDYRIFNADGSEVGQCGNGARCVARFLADSGLNKTNKKTFTLATKERIIGVHLQDDGQVAVNMGVPTFDPSAVPFHAPSKAIRYTLEVDGLTPEIGVVNVGNPHAVLMVDNIDTAPVEIFGKKIESHSRFPEGVNVGFMQRIDNSHIRLRVYERGTGETLACGSGACAAAVIGQAQGLLNQEVEVQLTGGKLQIRWLGEDQPVWMIGPAQTVFQGSWLT